MKGNITMRRDAGYQMYSSSLFPAAPQDTVWALVKSQKEKKMGSQ